MNLTVHWSIVVASIGQSSREYICVLSVVICMTSTELYPKVLQKFMVDPEEQTETHSLSGERNCSPKKLLFVKEGISLISSKEYIIKFLLTWNILQIVKKYLLEDGLQNSLIGLLSS